MVQSGSRNGLRDRGQRLGRVPLDLYQVNQGAFDTLVRPLALAVHRDQLGPDLVLGVGKVERGERQREVLDGVLCRRIDESNIRGRRGRGRGAVHEVAHLDGGDTQVIPGLGR